MAGAKIVEYGQRVAPEDGSGGAVRARPMDLSGIGGLSGENVGNLGRAMSKVAMALREREEEEARAWTIDTLSEMRLKWSTELKNRQLNAEPNAPQFTPRILEDFDKDAEEFVGKAPSDTAKNFLRDRVAAFRTELGYKATEFEAVARTDYQDDRFVSAIDKGAKLMNTDPSQYEQTLGETLAIIDASSMPVTRKSARRQSAVDKISSAAVWSKVQRDPGQWLSSIGFSPADGEKARKFNGDLNGVTGDKAFDALPFEKRTQMFEGAVRLKAQMDADAEHALKKKVEAMRDDAMKEIWSRNASGKLSRSFVEQYRGILSVEQYHSALTALKGGDGPKTDPATFRQILQLQTEGKYDEAQALAFKAHRNGLLSNEHLKSEVGQLHSLSRQGGPKTEYERSRAYLIGSLDPGPMVNDPVQKGRLAEAMYEFDTWVNGGKRTDAEIAEQGRQIAQRYRLVDLTDTVIALPMPRSGAIRRNPGDLKGMAQDIATAAAKADADFKAKKITEQEYNNEMALLNRWRKTTGRANGNR